MTMAAITKQGLVAIAILVAVLWGCLVSERLTVRKANLEMGRVLREMREMRIKVRHEGPVAPARQRGALA